MKTIRENVFEEKKNFVIFYHSKPYKNWVAFDFLESVNESKEVLKKSSYFKIWKLQKDGTYKVLTTKKRLSDKIIRDLAKKIVASPYRDMLKQNIKSWREKMQAEMNKKEKKNAL